MAWVSTSPLVKKYTLEEFWELPDPPDRSKLELIGGVLYLTPPPGYQDENAVSKLSHMLFDYMTATGDRGRLYFPRAGIMKKPNSWLEPDCFMCPPKHKPSLILNSGLRLTLSLK